MAEMLTAKQMQELLQVDRSTIYRMAEVGQLPAVKVGKQWRFPADLVQNWLRTQTITATPSLRSDIKASSEDFGSLLPLACIQLVQDTFADALGVMIVVTDIEGNPVTQASNPCGLFAAISDLPGAVQKCVDSWHDLASAIDLEPKFVPSHLGLLCARGMVRVGTELKGMVVVGGIAPDHWPPSPDEIQVMARDFGVEPEVLTEQIMEVFFMNKDQRAMALSFVQRIANIVAHIANERNTLVGKLQSIAELSSL